MKLSFYAREDLLAYAPGTRPTLGAPPPYIGRVLAEGRRLPATEAPHEFVVDRSKPDGEAVFSRLRTLAQRGAIWCADRMTANECSVAFVPVQYVDGAWIKAAPQTKKEHRR